MKYYMHTINNKPAFYSECDNQICFAVHFGAAHHNILADNLEQIRKEQKITEEFRRDNNLTPENDYGYIIIYSHSEENQKAKPAGDLIKKYLPKTFYAGVNSEERLKHFVKLKLLKGVK